MNEMQVFQNSEFGELGVLEIDGKAYFPATKCAKMLGYQDAINAIKQHCKGVAKHHVPTRGGTQIVNFIPEGDLYRLITHSKLPSAERFERWVFDEVLPTIRKTGGYDVKTDKDITINRETLALIISTTIAECLKQIPTQLQSQNKLPKLVAPFNDKRISDDFPTKFEHLLSPIRLTQSDGG